MTFDEVRDAIKNVEDMQLAHEIVKIILKIFFSKRSHFTYFGVNFQKYSLFQAINPDFRLQPYQPPETSLEKRIKAIMHDAFWDLLREELHADPPVYDHAVALLGDIKEVKQISLKT